MLLEGKVMLNKSTTCLLFRRMQNFENDLCVTVDAILELLGHTPQVVRDQYTLAQAYGQVPLRPQKIELPVASGRSAPPPTLPKPATTTSSCQGQFESMYPGVW